MLTRKIAPLACALLFAAAACSDTTGFDGHQLSAAEAADLAEEYAAIALSGVSLGLEDMPQSSPAGTAAVEGAPSATWSKTVTFTRECEGGGTITLSGSISGDLDENRSGTLTIEKTLTIDDCVHQRGDVTLTVHTDPPIVFTGTVVIEHRQRTSGEFTKTGTIWYVASNGREGSCVIDVKITWSADGGRSVTGTFCGHPVNRTGR